MKKPPKDRSFLGLVSAGRNTLYWDIFFWAKREDGVRKSGYVDNELYDMPKIIRWEELPEIKEGDYD